MSTLKKIKNWYLFAKRSWLALGAGWFAILIGFTPVLRLDRAGALLICGVIVAEIFHEKRHRLFINQVHPGVSTSYTYREVDKPDKNYKGIEITVHQMHSGKTVVNADNWTLYQLSNETEFMELEGSRVWNLDGTMKRLENTVDYSIVASAVIGTIFWAFLGPT